MKNVMCHIAQGLVDSENGEQVDRMVKDQGLNSVLRMTEPSPWFIARYEDQISWDYLTYCNLPDATVQAYRHKLDLAKLLANPCITEKIIPSLCSTPEHWRIVSQCQNLSDDFILEHRDHLDLDTVIEYQTMTDFTMEALIKHQFGANTMIRLDDLYSHTFEELDMAAELIGD